MFLPTTFHQFSFKSLQSLKDFFHLALFTATVVFRTRSLCEIRTQDRVLCIRQLMYVTNPLRIAFRSDSTTPSSLRLLLNVCKCTDPHVPSTKMISLTVHPALSPSAFFLCYSFKAFNQDIMLISRTRLSTISVILSLV